MTFHSFRIKKYINIVYIIIKNFFPIMRTAALRRVKFHVHYCLLINYVLVKKNPPLLPILSPDWPLNNVIREYATVSFSYKRRQNPSSTVEKNAAVNLMSNFTLSGVLNISLCNYRCYPVIVIMSLFLVFFFFSDLQ